MTERTEFCAALIGRTDEACVCWPWNFGTSGYGYLYIGKTYRSASRYVCILAHGLPAKGMEAAHSCGNRWCVNPCHLSWKTKKANALDRDLHGTMHRGEKSRRAKLTDEQVRYIRLADKTAVEMSRELGINARTIAHARSGRRWSHITDPAPVRCKPGPRKTEPKEKAA